MSISYSVVILVLLEGVAIYCAYRAVTSARTPQGSVAWAVVQATINSKALAPVSRERVCISFIGHSPDFMETPGYTETKLPRTQYSTNELR